MDQSKFNNQPGSATLAVPKRSFSLEFFVGLFAMAGVGAAAYLAVGLAGLELNSKDTYLIYAEFDNISGLKYGASVEIAGVPIGEVSDIVLKDPVAKVTLKLTRSVKLKEGGTMIETESVIDIEDVIGKVVHSLTGDKEDDESKK